MRKVDKHYIFDFGKYRGRTLKEVRQCNPSYIRWCVDKGILEVPAKFLQAKVSRGYTPSLRTEPSEQSRLKDPWYDEESGKTFYESYYQGEKFLKSYNADGTSTVYFGGPCGPADFDEFGNMM